MGRKRTTPLRGSDAKGSIPPPDEAGGSPERELMGLSTGQHRSREEVRRAADRLISHRCEERYRDGTPITGPWL